MAIIGLEGLTPEELKAELARGGRFVVFLYCISILILTFKRPSDVHFVRRGESTLGRSLGYTLLSLLLGWWGIPWGPIYTLQAVFTNLGGGKDVTAEVVASMTARGL